MKKRWIVMGMAALAAVTLFSASTASRVKWADDQSRAWLANKWNEHCKQWGPLSNNVIFAYSIDTNFSLAFITDGTNSRSVELGFRDDGVVVWRTKPDVMH